VNGLAYVAHAGGRRLGEASIKRAGWL